MGIESLEKEVEEIHEALISAGNMANRIIEDINEEYVYSAQNLISYLTLRSYDLREIQVGLTELGISSLGTGAGYVLENVSRTLELIRLIRGVPVERDLQRPSPGYRESIALLEARSESLFNVLDNELRTKIMVTMPDEASDDTALLKGFLTAGMQIIRINLSHGDKAHWNRILENSKRASEALQIKTCVYMDLPGPKIRVGHLYKRSTAQNGFNQVNAITLAQDDYFILMKEGEYDKLSSMETIPYNIITVALPEIIEDLKVDHSVFFDDGAIEGKVISKSTYGILVQILNTTKRKLRSGRGMNLPDTKLSLPSLTLNDLELLPYACENADIIGYSFVRTPEDVKLLYAKLNAIQDSQTGVVFKIENKEAFNNLPRILLEAMKRPKIGVMIARGDLAVEIGFDRISEVTNQIMSICEAAHIPVIWATQVLENMAKKGLATRAEISDVVLSVQAECVMLNKGPYVIDTIRILKNILLRMEDHYHKNKKTLRALQVARHNLKIIKEYP